MTTTHAAFISGATGTQGSALARQLRALGWDVHAIARNPEAAAAKALSAIGVQITKGDWDDEAALKSAIAGTKHLFLVFFPDFRIADLELTRARRILSLGRDAGVQHVIYSSDFALQGSGDSSSPADLVRRSKRNIERATAEAGFPAWTILRPGYFMANFVAPKVAMMPGAAEKGVFTFAYPADTEIPLVDPEDIARFAVAAFQDPARFRQQTIRIASEIRPLDEIVAALAAAAGRNLRAVYLTKEEVVERGKTDIFIQGQAAVPQMAGLVDMNQVRGWGVQIGTFEDFLAREKEAVLETYKNVKE